MFFIKIVELIEERIPEKGSYSVAYSFPDKTIRVAKYRREDNVLKALLEIQRTGLDFRVENLEFENGVVSHRDISSTSFTHFYDPRTIKPKLEVFALEFKKMFEDNVHLREALPLYFTAISNHLKQ